MTRKKAADCIQRTFGGFHYIASRAAVEMHIEVCGDQYGPGEIIPFAFREETFLTGYNAGDGSVFHNHNGVEDRIFRREQFFGSNDLSHKNSFLV